jgi:hypothetical protein
MLLGSAQFLLKCSSRKECQNPLATTTTDLGGLFSAALQALAGQRQQINDLDGYNGNHGDNMVENLRVIQEALRAQQANSPSEALNYASRELQARGRGGTSQHYARGLGQAAQQLQGRSELELDDVASLLQAMLGSVPARGGPAQAGAAGPDSLVEGLSGLLGGQPQPQSNVLEDLLGMAGSPQAGQTQADAGGAADMIEKLLPAGMAFLQAKQAGADNASAAQQALMSALLGGSINPTRATSPRSAAGGVLAQSILSAFLNR